MSRFADSIRAGFAAAKSVFTAATLGASLWFRGLTASWSSASYARVARMRIRNAYAARATRVVYDNLASVPVIVKKGDKEAPKSDTVRLLDAATLDGRRLGWAGLVKTLARHEDFSGEWFLELPRPDGGPNRTRPALVIVHRPDRVSEVIRDPRTDEITGYRVSNRRGGSRVVPAEQMHHHIAEPNPVDEERGIGLMTSALRALDRMEAADTWNASLSQSGGRVPGFWKPNMKEGARPLTSEQVNEAEAVMDARIDERQAAQKPMVLSGNFDFVDTSIAPKDAEFMAADREAARRICIVAGVDPALVGDASNRTYSNLKEARTALYLLTVLPRLDAILGALEDAVAVHWGETLTYNRDAIEALQEDMTEKYRRYIGAVAGGLVTPNEARDELGWDEISDAEMNAIRKRPAPTLPPAPEPPAKSALGHLLDSPDAVFDAALARLTAPTA